MLQSGAQGRRIDRGLGDCFYGGCRLPEPNADFAAVAVGGNHNLGLKVDGSIVGWGRNNLGQCDVPEPNADFTAAAAATGIALV